VLRFGEGPAAASGYATGRRQAGNVLVKKGPNFSGEVFLIMFTLWLFNIAMENGPFIDGLPIKNGEFP